MAPLSAVDFGYELLAAVATEPEAELRRLLRNLTLSGLVEVSGRPPRSVYRFKHALIRDAAYQSLLRRERQTLHGRIAAVLQDRFPELQVTEPELLAHHLTESGATAAAIPLWLAAGQRAASRAAHVEAVVHLQTALRLLRQQPVDAARAAAELQLLLGLAVSLSASRGYSVPEVGQLLHEARAICDAMNDHEGLFWVLRALYSFLNVAGDLAGAEELAQRCEAIAVRTGLAEHRLESDCPLGHIRWARGKLSAARRNLDNVERLYPALNGSQLVFQTPQDPLVASLSVLPMVAFAMGDTVEADRAADALLHHLAILGRPFDAAYGLCWQALYHWIAGRPARASEFIDKSLALSEANGYAAWRAIAAALKATVVGHHRDLDKGLDLLRRAVADWERLGIVHTRGFFIGELARLYLRAGDPAAALNTIAQAIDYVTRHDDRYFLPILHCYHAEILREQPVPDTDSVAAALRQALIVANEQEAKGFADTASQHLEPVTGGTDKPRP